MRPAATFITIALLAGACQGQSQGDEPGDPFATAADGLCDTLEVAEQPDEARRLFFDTVHQPLHELADQTAAVDRAVAAGLLEAKQAVEAGLDDDPAGLAADLDRLADATHAALTALDRPGLDCRSTP